MRKPAPSNFELHQVISERWSPRAFSGRPVEVEKLVSLLESARWSPSSFNEQPWSFIIGLNQEPVEFTRLFSCLTEVNQRWADKAGVLMVAVAHLIRRRDGLHNRYAFHDVGMAIATMTFQATAMGLHVHHMGGFDRDRVRDMYGIPSEYEPATAIAVGYAGNPESLPDDLRIRELAPRARKPLGSFVFSGTWGIPAKETETAAGNER